jgi:hypothetical protein
LKVKAQHLRFALSKLQKEVGELTYVHIQEGRSSELRLSAWTPDTQEKVVHVFSADSGKYPLFETFEILMKE